MKSLISILCLVATSNVYAQTTYLIDTALVTDVGYGGAPASCKTNHLEYNAVDMDRTQDVWVADVFTVPVGATWAFDTVIIYGYQYNSGLTSPFRNCNLQIYSGTPGLGGTVIWGDTVTNVLNSSAFTGIYKVDTFASDNGLLSTKRPIMYLKLYLSPTPRLSAGTYWLAWSAAGISTINPAVTPYKVLPGRINPPGQMARVFSGGAWTYITDSSNSIGLNMIIKAKEGLAAVPAVNSNTEYTLGQNVPNPFSTSTAIAYDLAEAAYVKLSVYNIVGQLVATLADGYKTAGHHESTFDASGIPAGNYYYKLSTAAGTENRQMVLVR